MVSGAISTLLGAWDQNGLLYHPASEEASDQGVGALFLQAPEDEGGTFGHFITSDSQASEGAVV